MSVKNFFCVLEQSGRIGDLETRQKKEIFQTSFSSFYRLNWAGKNDPDADIIAQNLTWSEGRSLLYEIVPKDFEYYIFIDDDIVFSSDNKCSVADQIFELLIKYKPIAGTFLDFDSWAFSWLKPGELNDQVQGPSFPICGFDLQAHFFHKSLADLVFPVPFHGSGKSMWYAQWICATLYPRKQICLTGVTVSNTRHDSHQDLNHEQFGEPDKLVWLFNRDIKKGVEKMRFARGDLIIKNENLFRHLRVSSAPQLARLSDLPEIYDVRNWFFSNRSAVNSRGYRRRMKYMNFLWFLSTLRVRSLMRVLKKYVYLYSVSIRVFILRR